jgi:hypothetical protein
MCLLLIAAWSGSQVYRLSGQRAEIKKDTHTYPDKDKTE